MALEYIGAFIIGKFRGSIRAASCMVPMIAFFLCALLHGAPKRMNDKFADIISDGETNLSIVIGGKPEEKEAAEILKEILGKMSKRSDISISSSIPKNGFNGTSIFIRKDNDAKILTPDTANIDGTLNFKFKIYPNSVHILYPSDNSAINAVGFFLKKFCGVKFFAPGPIGTEIPRPAYLKIRTGNFEVNPSFKGRNLGLFADKNFAKLIGNSDDFTSSNHSMPQIIDAKTAALHPAWMARIDGKLQPHSNRVQVDFANSAMRLFVKEYAEKYFAENPKARIFSLTPADSSDFDNTPYSERLKRGFTANGYMDCSNLVFSFVNEISKFIRSKYPSKFVYSLAYLYTENPPSFKIADNIIVYLCEDRGNFFSSEKMSANTELLKKWSNSGTKFFGIYDYNYGNPYFIPRNTFQQIAYSIKNAFDAGARFYTCESFPNWAYDAHKIWLLSNLLTDASLDTEKLENEFFDSYYGESSKHIKEFFDIAQEQWNKRNDRPMWLTLYKRWEQAEIFPKESLDRMEAKLALAEKGAKSPMVIDRIKEIRLMFDVTKSLANTYRLQKKLWMYNISNTPKEHILDTIEAVKISKAIQKLDIKRYYENTKYPKASFKIWDELDYMDPSEMLAENMESRRLEYAKNMLGEPDFRRAFSGGNSLWQTRKSDNANLKIKKSGNALTLSAWLPAYLYQRVEISENKKYSFNIKVSGNLEIGAVFYIELSFYSEEGRLLSKKRLRIPPLGSFKDKEMSISQVSPKGSKYAVAAIFAISMRESDFVEIKKPALWEKSR